MDWKTFYSDISSGVFAPIYIFDGAEELVKKEALDALRAAVLPAGLEMLNETLLENPTARSITDAAETMPVMSDKRLVIARDWPAMMPGQSANIDSEIDTMLKYALKPCEYSIIVIYLRGEGEPKRKSAQNMRAAAKCVEFMPLSEADISAWINKRLRAYKKKMNAQTARMLIATAGNELNRIAGEIEKLAAFTGDRTEIDISDVDAVVSPSIESNIFKMLDNLIGGNASAAMYTLNAMLEAGENRVAIIAGITRQIRGISAMRHAIDENQSAKTAQNLLEMKSFVADKMYKQARNFTTVDIDNLYTLCLDADNAIKTGQMRDNSALDMIFIKIAETCAKKVNKA